MHEKKETNWTEGFILLIGVSFVISFIISFFSGWFIALIVWLIMLCLGYYAYRIDKKKK